MDLPILDELQPIAEELQQYMSPHVLEHLAKEIGFVHRKSKYQAKELVALCVWLSQQVASTSLTQLCSCL
ncbi:IS4 family transposase, partial [Bacillus cereus]